MEEKVTINAVHEYNAKNLWKSLKLKEKELCLICHSDVTANTYSALGAYKGKIAVCCEKGSCFLAFSYKIKGLDS